MKKYISLFLLLIIQLSNAQNPCEYTTNVNDSIGTYKTTSEFLMHEKVFAGKSSYVFFSLSQTNGIPGVTVQIIQKSKEFLKANCFNKDSKLYLQLNDGSIITLIHTEKEICASLVRDENGTDNRIMVGNFLFLKSNFEKLKTSEISLLRIKYNYEMEDYIIKKEFKSELDNKTYESATYFMKYLDCVIN